MKVCVSTHRLVRKNVKSFEKVRSMSLSRFLVMILTAFFWMAKIFLMSVLDAQLVIMGKVAEMRMDT